MGQPDRSRESDEPRTDMAEASSEAHNALIDCVLCLQPFVRSAAEEDVSAEHGLPEQSVFEVTLHCGNCNTWFRGGPYSYQRLESADQAYYDRQGQLLGNLRDVTRVVMEDETNVFSEALHRGHILPEDF